jgi:hypothetical protein
VNARSGASFGPRLTPELIIPRSVVRFYPSLSFKNKHHIWRETTRQNEKREHFCSHIPGGTLKLEASLSTAKKPYTKKLVAEKQIKKTAREYLREHYIDALNAFRDGEELTPHGLDCIRDYIEFLEGELKPTIHEQLRIAIEAGRQ